MNHGVKPITRKKHHLSTRSFGAATLTYEPFSLDAGFGFPDQNADGWPEECTVYAQTELCQDEDKQQYDRTFLRAKTDLISGQSQGPYDVEDSIEAVCIYGVAKAGETDVEAESRKRGHPFWLEKMPGMDWFDSALALMQQTRCPLSVVSPWFPAFETAYKGLMPASFPLAWPAGTPGHNHVIYGLTSLNGQPAFMDKSWQGTAWGNQGVCYWTREAFNNLMDIPGAGAFTLAPWDGSVVSIEWGIFYRLKLAVRLKMRQLAQGLGSPDPDSYFDAWDTPEHNWHNVRVLCDLAGLTIEEKNTICACIYQESQFYNYEPDGKPVICQNKDKTGAVWSTDWGICQINDWYHIAPHGTPFASVAYVLANPAEAVKWMIQMYQDGHLNQWSSYSSGAYRKWLLSTSPMWNLAKGG